MTKKIVRKRSKSANKRSKEEQSKSVIPMDRIRSYTTHDVKTGSGKRRAVDNDDIVASALRGTTEDQWNEIARQNEVNVKNWKSLNPGLKRLALGNTLRKTLNTDGKIIVLGKTVRNKAA